MALSRTVRHDRPTPPRRARTPRTPESRPQTAGRGNPARPVERANAAAALAAPLDGRAAVTHHCTHPGVTVTHHRVDPAVREAVEAALLDKTDRRSRAELARAHGVSTRTISRWADELGVDTPARWSTADTRAATEAATDRRRALRSQLADDILNVEVPRIRERLAEVEVWSKTVVIPGEGGGTERVNEDDAIVMRGLKDAMTALRTAVGTTVDIDRHDTQDADDGASATLGRLFDGLGAAYQAITGRNPTDEQDTPA